MTGARYGALGVLDDEPYALWPSSSRSASKRTEEERIAATTHRARGPGSA